MTTKNIEEGTSGGSALTDELGANANWKRKWYMNYDYCPQCEKRFSQHDMNCIECCPVKRGEVQTANAGGNSTAKAKL